MQCGKVFRFSLSAALFLFFAWNVGRLIARSRHAVTMSAALERRPPSFEARPSALPVLDAFRRKSAALIGGQHVTPA